MIIISKIINTWGSSPSIRLSAECKELGWKAGDKVHTIVKDGKIIIEKVITEFKVVNGITFNKIDGITYGKIENINLNIKE